MRNQKKKCYFFQDLQRKKTFFSTSFSQQVQLPDYSVVWIDFFLDIQKLRIRELGGKTTEVVNVVCANT